MWMNLSVYGAAAETEWKRLMERSQRDFWLPANKQEEVDSWRSNRDDRINMKQRLGLLQYGSQQSFHLFVSSQRNPTIPSDNMQQCQITGVALRKKGL